MSSFPVGSFLRPVTESVMTILFLYMNDIDIHPNFATYCHLSFSQRDLANVEITTRVLLYLNLNKHKNISFHILFRGHLIRTLMKEFLEIQDQCVFLRKITQAPVFAWSNRDRSSLWFSLNYIYILAKMLPAIGRL